MAKKQLSTEMNLSDEWINILKTYVSIGSRSPYGSFVLIKKDRMKVMNESATIISEYKYPEINIEKSIALFDAAKLLSVVQMFKNSGKPYTFEFLNNYQLVVKSGRNKVSLYLVKHKEVGSREEAGINDEYASITDYVIVTDEKFASKIEEVKEDKLAVFTLTKEDLKKIEEFQRIMRVSDRLFSITKGDEGIKFVISQDSIKDNPDAASFEITEGVEFNEIKSGMEFSIEITKKMKDIESRNYKVTLANSGMMVFESLDDDLRYIISTEDLSEEITEQKEDAKESEDFDFEQ